MNVKLGSRGLTILLVCVPVTALFVLLVWASVTEEDAHHSVGINYTLGEVQIDSRPAPYFNLDSIQGTKIDSTDFGNKVVMLDFWSSWCPPCRTEAPLLSRLHQTYEKQPVEFIGIAVWDDPTNIQAFVEEFDIEYAVGIDPKGRIAIEYGVIQLPVKYFIDPHGNILKKFDGPMDEVALRLAIDSMLGDSNASVDFPPSVDRAKVTK